MTTHDAAPGSGRIRCVGAIVVDDAGRLLLIQRGHEPAKGLWSVPGGKVEPGETDEEAVRREIAEETGLVVTVGALAGRVERPGAPGVVYEIYDYDAVLAPHAPSAAVPAPPALGDAWGLEATFAESGEAADRIGAPGPGHAGDDAADLIWASRAEMSRLPLTDGLVDALTAWGRMPR